MRSRSMILAAAIAAVLPLTGLHAQACAPRPMPPPSAALDWTADNWPQGEALRFSAAPARRGRAYLVEVSRPTASAEARVHLVKLERAAACNRWDLEQEWTFPLGREDANLFFERIGEIEAHWQPPDEIVLDGTSFGYAHRTGGTVRSLRLSATAQGETGRLSALILSLMRVARGEIPEKPDWYD